MPLLVDHLLFVLIVAGLAVRAWFGIRALKAIPVAELPDMRPRFWLRAIASQWLLVLGVAAWWAVQRRPFGWLGLVPHFGWGFGGVMLGVVVMSFAVRAQYRAIVGSADLRARLRERLAGVSALMPATQAEFPGFASLALTAGICEEFLFRGFVTWWLLHYVSAFWLAIVLQGALFGLAHAYQGPRGVLATGMVGLFMGAVVWVTGSLWAAMILHSLIDLHAGVMAVTVYERDTPGTPTPA
jgi:membrane protease YdiL (CAAX protease family)